MKNRAYLNSFLKILKEELGFDFNIKSFNDRVLLQKYVYLAKYFGWEHSYLYSLYIRGPYSSNLADDYYNPDIDCFGFAELGNFNKSDFMSFVENHDIFWLESAATMNYLFKYSCNVDREECIEQISRRKPDIPHNIIEDTYDYSIRYGLMKVESSEIKGSGIDSEYSRNIEVLSETEKNLEEPENLDIMKEFVECRMNELMNYFSDLPVNRNNTFILGSIDYLLLVLEKETVDNSMKMDLFDFINKYVIKMESIHNLIIPAPDVLESIDLAQIENEFDLLQDYVSQELEILPRLDDESIDLELLVF